jgi:hypothetical protein
LCQYICVLSVVLLDAAVRFVSDDNLVLPTTQPSSDRHSSTTDAGHALHDGSSTAAKGQGQLGQKAGLYVPKGSILCICPIESHHDPALFPDQPWAFNPDRWAGLTGVARLWSLTVMLCRGRQKQPCKLPMLATGRESLVNLWSWEGVGSTLPGKLFCHGLPGEVFDICSMQPCAPAHKVPPSQPGLGLLAFWCRPQSQASVACLAYCSICWCCARGAPVSCLCREAIQGLAPGTVVPGVAGMGFGGGFWR